MDRADIVIVGVGGRHRQYRGLVLGDIDGVHHVHQGGRTTGHPTTGNVLHNHRRRGAGGGTAHRTLRQRLTGKAKEVTQYQQPVREGVVGVITINV